jgi:hypothetical protein
MDVQTIGNVVFAVLGAAAVYLGQFIADRVRGRLDERSEA